MKCKITIEAFDHGVFGLDVKVEGASRLDRVLMVDALVESLDFDENERMELGALIAIGGFKVIKKDAMTKMAISPELAELIKKKRGNDE
ncbi:MAG: hypothetical protein IKU94_06830 [Bacteroidaceae bacterium]|nr:hypothetical protein [Bacteroidaceae bacterium]